MKTEKVLDIELGKIAELDIRTFVAKSKEPIADISLKQALDAAVKTKLGRATLFQLTPGQLTEVDCYKLPVQRKRVKIRMQSVWIYPSDEMQSLLYLESQ